MRSCFKDLENDKILQAAARLVDPREWPTEEADLASYGADHLRVITDHFADILDLVDPERLQSFPNLLMVVELILVLPLSTAA
ncbi:hypothetical protein AAFF_G00262520 [Aldrovandia affinis]|uniref:Uncharacterized protein n=1 Tax=Aldrovandia affinis TaxID=143900 RepID=A0AAD7SSH2_9TELE|nr:hypothetical protein AAFF_G00262520 [Aldrovandia affinis]